MSDYENLSSLCASTQKNANLIGAAMSTQTTVSGDEYVEVKANTPARERDYMYAFVSNNEMSAGLWSNSEYEGRNAGASSSGGSNNTRVMSLPKPMSDYENLSSLCASTMQNFQVPSIHSRLFSLKQT